MELDKELYRKSYRAIKEWKERESIDRMLQARYLSPQQAWNQYIALWELLLTIAPTEIKYQHVEHLKNLDQYYTKVQKLQEWMKSNGEAA
jgi:hypothetical protein